MGTHHRMPRIFALVCVLLYATAYANSEFAKTNDAPLLPREDPSHKVVITRADGSTKEMTRGELTELQREQEELQRVLQNKEEPQWVERKSMDELAHKDPVLARQIHVAADAFAVLQRHGYAKGYKLAGFSELDAGVVASASNKKELRITIQLRAIKDPKAKGKYSTGTSATKSGDAPSKLAYEADVLLDSNDGVSVVKAWQLRKDDSRGKQLTIKPSEELLKRQQQHRAQVVATSPLGAYGTWMLAGGVVLIVVGIAMVFLSSRDQPAPASAEPAKKTSPTGSKARRKDAKSVTKREAGDGWELAN